MHILQSFCIAVFLPLFGHNKTPKVFCLTFGVHVTHCLLGVLFYCTKLFPALSGVFLSAVGLAGVFEDHEGDQAGEHEADEDVGPSRSIVAFDAGPHFQEGFGVGVMHDAATLDCRT